MKQLNRTLCAHSVLACCILLCKIKLVLCFQFHKEYAKIERFWLTWYTPNSFYRDALNEGRSSQEKAVCTAVRLSVCPSVCQTRALWQNERKISPDFFIPYERSFSLVFWKEEQLVGATLHVSSNLPLYSSACRILQHMTNLWHTGWPKNRTIFVRLNFIKY